MTGSDESDIDALERTIRDQWRVPLDSRQKCASSKNGKKGFRAVVSHAHSKDANVKRVVSLSRLNRKPVPITLAPIGKKGSE